MAWWNRKVTQSGTVLFRGDLAAQMHEFAYLENKGIMIKSQSNTPGGWKMELNHPDWGNATLIAGQGVLCPPKEVIQFAFIPEQDKIAAMSAGNGIDIIMESSHDNVLRDRKLLLRYMQAVMGTDGFAAVDNLSFRIWTPDDINDELMHDADLDVEGIVGVHLVTNEKGERYWLHTHGLSAVGSYDFDVFYPSESVIENAWELVRAVSYHLLEETIGPSTSNFPLIYPNGYIKLMPMEEFLQNTTPEIQKDLAESIDDSDKDKHLVLCQPEKRLLGIFGRKNAIPVKCLTSELMENPMFSFSDKASDLMRDRAKNTLGVLIKLREEFKEFDFPCVVKLGIPTDPGIETSHEHMWFSVEELTETQITGELGNQPYYVSSMKAGDHSTQSTDLLSDWMMMTPMGFISPRSTSAARMVRSNPDKVKKAMEAAAMSSDGHSLQDY